MCVASAPGGLLKSPGRRARHRAGISQPPFQAPIDGGAVCSPRDCGPIIGGVGADARDAEDV